MGVLYDDSGFVEPQQSHVGETAVQATARQVALARKVLEFVMEQAKEVALEELAKGATEAGVARDLGIDRMTIRKWAGKR